MFQTLRAAVLAMAGLSLGLALAGDAAQAQSVAKPGTEAAPGPA